MSASPKSTEDASNRNPITPHPFADIFPPMSDQEREELQKSIKKNGLRKKIIIDKQNRILDGLNRYRACIAVGVPPEFELFEGTEEEARALIWDGNMVRRHLATSVKAAIGADWTQLEQGQHKSGNSQITVQQVRSSKNKKDASAKAKAATSHIKKSSPRARVVGKIEMLDDEGRPLQDHYSKLFAVMKAISRLPDELRGLRSFIENDEHHFPPSGLAQFKQTLTKLARTDFKDLIAAAEVAIADLTALMPPSTESEGAQAPNVSAITEARKTEPAA